MATNPQAFYCLWRDEAIRERLFELLSHQDICAVRLASSACCNLVTKRLFLRTHLTFNANALTRASRLDALSRIGHHIEHLTFYFPHSNATFLPPLIHPQSGEEMHFLYNPHTSAASALTKAKYDHSDLGEILTQQYPPLFHAATHVPSFIHTLQHMPNMRHLTIKTPGQDPRERYRRDVVDYALTSLRIAVERAPLHKLSKLSLSGVHPSAFTYLRHVPGLGASPSASLRWRQIRKLYIAVDSWDFYGPSPGRDHLRIIEDFIRAFAPALEKFAFTWLGRRGPCPIALSDDPLFAPARTTRKLFNEVTGPMSPLPATPATRPLVLPRLRALSVRNATMNVPQLRALVASHKRSVREFDFENVALVRGGSWEEALAPLTEGGEGEAWARKEAGHGGVRESGGVRPSTSRSNSSGSGSAVASSVEDEHLPASSAAAAAASRELFEVDLEGMMFGGVNDAVDTFEAGVEEWARGVSAAAAAQEGSGSRPNTSSGPRPESDGGLASDIEAARLASEGFSTKLKKRRIHRRSSRKNEEEGIVEEEEAYYRNSERRPDIYRQDSQHSSQHRPDIRRQDSQLSQQSHRSHHSERSHRSHHTHHSRSHHKHSRSDDTSDRVSTRGSHHRRHRAAATTPHHQRHHSHDPETPVFMPEVIGTDDEACPAYSPPRSSPATPRSPAQPPTPRSPYMDMDISVPILNPDPLPVMLQPTVYDPSAKCGPFVRATPPPLSRSNTSSSTASGMSAGVDSLLSSAQRSIEADMLAEAEEAAARASALQRAKQAVITKLSREFSRRGRGERGGGGKDSAAVVASMSTLNLGVRLDGVGNGGSGSGQQHHSGLSCASSSSVGYRLREGLFGRSLANVAIAPDHRSLESQSALVPLIFARS